MTIRIGTKLIARESVKDYITKGKLYIAESKPFLLFSGKFFVKITSDAGYGVDLYLSRFSTHEFSNEEDA